MTTGYWIGIDGGGTKTLGVLLDERQNIQAELRGDSTNFNSVGGELARVHLRQLIIGLLDKAGVSAAQIAGIGLGVSGVSRPEDQQMVATWVADVLPDIPCLVENDALMALAAATDGDLFGVVVVCGTGMIVVGVNRAGERRRAGGWGALLDERGSGFAIGSDALKAVASAEDGLGAPTMLTEAVLSHLHLSSPRELERWTYTDYNWARIAALAPLVSQCAVQGDAVSGSILEASAIALCRSVRVVAERLGIEDTPFPCVFMGGNLRPGAPLIESLTQHLRTEVHCARVDTRQLSPAVGAALLAQRQMK
jgi:N-acetylglucosamine kinase-like BadF-type ATPase